MPQEREPIDISNNPDLLLIVEEIRQRNTSAVLRNGTEDVAVVTLIADGARQKRTKRKKTEADHDAFVQAAGSWKGLIDAEAFKAYISERRKTKNRPSVNYDLLGRHGLGH